MKKTLFYAAAAVLLLTACTNDETNAQLENSDIISLSASVSGNNTRASLSDADIQNTQFVADRSIYVEAYKTGVATTYTTGTYTTGANGAMTGSLKYPADGTNIDIMAYHPAQNGENNVTSSLTSFVVGTDQTSVINYQDSDLMYATKLTNKAKGTTHELTFTHALARIVVNLTADASIDDASLTHLTCVTINGTKTTATITSGVWQSEAGSVADINITGTTKASHSGIIVPQTVAAETTFITITYNGNALTYKIPAGGKTFAAGNSYTYNFTVKASSITLQSSSITAWTNENIAGGDLVI